MGSEAITRIHVSILGVDPPIWRRILVPSDIALDQLHQVLQLSMGWTDSHLHEFNAGGRVFGEPDPDEDDPPEDEADVTLDQFLAKKGDTLHYLYDFGDGWDHEVVLEKTIDRDPAATYPVCLAGERAGPPEDCGGADGYEAFLEAIGDPEHEEHESMLEWVGGDFDPEAFDIEWVNEILEAIGRVEWVGAMFALPSNLLENGPGQPWVVAWLDPYDAVIIEHSVVTKDARFETALNLLEAALEESAGGNLKRPDRLRIEDPALAAAVSKRLGGEIEVMEEETPEVDDIQEDLVGHIARSWQIVQAMGTYLPGEIEPRDVAMLFEAAARLYRANPWKKIRGRIEVEVQAEPLGLDGALMSLGGEPGENPGMYMVETPADQAFLLEPLSASLPDDDSIHPEGPLRVLLYERGADVPQKMRREIAAHSWEVVDAHSYPKLLLIGSDGIPYVPRRHDLAITVACADAMAELAKTEARKLDARIPVTRRMDVETCTGTVPLMLTAPHTGLEAAAPGDSSYDAETSPDPEWWLELNEGDRMSEVTVFHDESGYDPPPENETLHVVTHVVVETHLALDDPPGARKALERLTGAGLGRHEAVHAVGSVVAEHIVGAIQSGSAPDNEAYARALDALTVDSWRHDSK